MGVQIAYGFRILIFLMFCIISRLTVFLLAFSRLDFDDDGEGNSKFLR